MANEKNEDRKGKQPGNGNGGQKYPELVPDPKIPERYTYDPPPDAQGVEAMQIGFKDFRTLIDSAINVKWLIKKHLEQNTVGMLFGDPGTYKSFILIDMALCIASGRAWHGNAVTQGPAVIIAGEGYAGLGKRVHAWAIHHDIPDKQNFDFHISEKRVDFLDIESVAALKQELNTLLKDKRPAFIGIDTLATNFGNGDENTAKDMGLFIRNVQDLVNTYECCALINHHTGHQFKQRARGSSSSKGALVCEYRADKILKTVVLTCTKMKDAEEAKPIAFDAVKIDLPRVDEDGVPQSSLILEGNDDATRIATADPKTKLGGNQKKMVQVFVECMLEVNTNLAAQEKPPKEYVYVDFLRDRCKYKNSHAFIRTLRNLVLRKILSLESDVFVYKGDNYDELDVDSDAF